MSVISPFRRRLLNSVKPKLPNYLCFTALEDTQYTLTIASSVTIADIAYVEYSSDGESWVHTDNINNTVVTITTPTIHEGDKVYWRGSGVKISRSNSATGGSIFSSTGRFNVSGILTSLLNGGSAKETDTITSNNNFARLFYSNTSLIDASELILPINTTESCYNGMFYNCSALVNVFLTLPAEIAAVNAHYYMFYGCASLQAAPEIAATEYKSNSCRYMFKGCTSLGGTILINATTIVDGYTCESMFNSTNIEKVVFTKNPSISVSKNCLLDMFVNCHSLKVVEGAKNIKTFSQGMFSNCSALESIDLDYSKITLISMTAFNGLTKGIFTGFVENIYLSSCTVIGLSGNSGGGTNLPNFNATQYILPELTEMWNNPFSGSNYKNNDLIAVVAPKVVTINHFRYGGPFENITSLELVDIGDTVTTIGTLYGANRMFGNANTSFVCRATTVPTLGDGLGTLKAIYVPTSAINDYKVATNWSGKSSIIYEIGGAEWIAEFGSADPYADYTKYNIVIN